MKENTGDNLMKILVLCDDVWHPAEVIEKGIASLHTKEYKFDFVKAAKDILTSECWKRIR